MIISDQPKLVEASEASVETPKEVSEPKKDALAEAMAAVGGDILGDVVEDDDHADKTAANDNDTTTDAEMDGASALAALASAAVAVDVSKKPTNGVTDVSGSDGKSKNVVDVSSEERRDANWFDVGIIKGTSCTVSSYYLPNQEKSADIDVEQEEILKKLDLQVGFFNCCQRIQLAVWTAPSPKSFLQKVWSRFGETN